MDPEFAAWFEHFATHHAVYYVTGSDRDKTLEQLGTNIYNLAIRSYQCGGNDVWEQNTNISSIQIDLPQSLLSDLDKIIDSSTFHRKTGRHIEYRPGMVNFSVVGRNANMEDRFLYREWDEHKDERRRIAIKLSAKYPEYNFHVAGETGIDITKVGHGKEQIIHDFDPNDKLAFFGDKMMVGGNDFDLARVVADRGDDIYNVKSWEETWEILKGLSG